MIDIRRFTRLAKLADEAAKEDDLATIATINADAELRSVNVQFLVRDKQTWMGLLDQLQAGIVPDGATWPGGKQP